MERAHRISVLLCRSWVQDFAQALRDDLDYEQIELRDDLPFDARLFVQFENPKPVPWLELLREGTKDEIGPHYNVSNSAVLVVRRTRSSGEGSDFFALPFGRGKVLLDENAYERNFGLRVALNSINPDQLVSLDLHTLEELPFHRRVQATRSAPPAEFDLDAYRDMLTSVTGHPSDDSSQWLTGRDASSARRHVSFDGLGALCDQLRSEYEDTAYQQRFGWIDYLSQVREPARRDELDDALVDLLRRTKRGEQPEGSAWMAPPEIIDWSEVEGFWITGTGRRRRTEGLLPDPDLDWYLNGIQRSEDIQLDTLKSHRVRRYSAEDEPIGFSWSVYRTLVVELDWNDRLYVLINGTWFEVAASLQAEVNDFVQTLEWTQVDLPGARPGEWERYYNERAADAASDLLLLDRVKVAATAVEGEIESCDLLHQDGVFVHVKRYQSGSASLSHLFAQGLVSADTFRSEAVFRQDLGAKLTERGASDEQVARLAPAQEPDPGDYEVAYAVVAASWPDGNGSLPFFAKLTLMRVARQLTRMGYRVTLTRIPVEE